MKFHIFHFSNFLSERERLYVASKINLLIAAIGILCIPLYFLNPNFISRWLFIHFSVLFSLTLSIYLIKKKKVIFSAWILALWFWIAVSYLSMTSGGVISIICFFYIIPILIAHLLINLKAGVFFTALSLLAIFYMYFDFFELVTEYFKPTRLDKVLAISIFLSIIHFVALAIFSIVRVSFLKLKNANLRKERAKRSLKSLNQNLNNVLESIINVGIIVTNTKGQIQSFNTGAENIFGYSRNELLETNIISLFDRDELKNLNKDTLHEFDFFRSLCENVTQSEFKKEEWTFVRKDKSKCKIELTIAPLYSAKNSISSYLLTLVDVTLAYETRTIIEILNRDLEEKVEERTRELQLANQSLMDMNLEMQKTLNELAKTQKYLIQSEKLAALGQLSAAIGHELNTPIGAIISSAYTQKDFMENICIPTLEKIYKLDEKDFEIFQKLLNECREIFRSPNILSKVTKKEIRNLLKENPYLTSDDFELIYEMNLNFSDAKIQNLLLTKNISLILELLHFFCQVKKTNQIITLASEKASNVLKSLRLYLSNPIDTNLEPIYLSKEIEIVLTLNQNRIKAGIEIIRDFKAKEPFLGNRGSLSQVWINLISNAIDAMNGKGTLKITSEMEENFVVVSFHDTGVGIPKEIQHKIFEPFFTTKKEGDGIGLGLHLCKKLVEKMNGNISFTSEPKNTVFKVKLPLISQN